MTFFGKLEEKESPMGESQFEPSRTPPRPTGSPAIGKELIKARNRPPFTKLANALNKEINNFIKRFKKFTLICVDKIFEDTIKIVTIAVK